MTVERVLEHCEYEIINLASNRLPKWFGNRCSPSLGILIMTTEPSNHTTIFETTVAALVTQDKALVKTTGKHGTLMFSTILSGSFVALEKYPTTPSKEEKAGFGKVYLSDLTTSSRKRVSTSIFKLVENHSELIQEAENDAEDNAECVERLQSAIETEFATTKTVKDKNGVEKEIAVPCDSFNKLAKALNPVADKTESENSMIGNNPDIDKLKKLFLMISKLSGDNVDQLTVYVSKMKETTDNPIVPLVSVEAFHQSLNKPLMTIVRDIRKSDAA